MERPVRIGDTFLVDDLGDILEGTVTKVTIDGDLLKVQITVEDYHSPSDHTDGSTCADCPE